MDEKKVEKKTILDLCYKCFLFVLNKMMCTLFCNQSKADYQTTDDERGIMRRKSKMSSIDLRFLLLDL